jgi:hypothetical protein
MILNNFKLIDTAHPNIAYQNCIWTFDFDPGEDISQEILSAEYQQLNSSLPLGARQNYIMESSSTLDEFIKKLDNLIFLKLKELIVAEDIKKIFQPRWPISLDQIDNNFFIRTHIFKDPANFSMGKHLDNQRVVANSIINLCDNDSTTEFFDYTDPSTAIFSTTGTKNKGVLFLNTPAALHHIKNFNSTRYTANSSIMIIKW